MFKYLGILIDSNLTWKQSISLISSKISKSLGILLRLRHFVPTDTFLNINRSLIQAYITYALLSYVLFVCLFYLIEQVEFSQLLS